ncbi:MAG: hypothetical protein H5T60_04270 [Anaerolineae bacterium]|nr:hypothetical protein [Anaerolineae bacterium]
MAQRGQVRLRVRQEILQLPHFSVAELVQRTGLREASIRTEITRLKRLGWIEAEPEEGRPARRGAPTLRYRLVPGARAWLAQSLAPFTRLAGLPFPLDPALVAPRVRVIGLGGIGARALTQMRRRFPLPAELIAAGTNAHEVLTAEADHHLVLGSEWTEGYGLGGDVSLGRRIAASCHETLAGAVAGADMVILLAGLGGGTGTALAPYLAGLARDAGALTIGIVTLPFSFEGQRRRLSAEEGLAGLRESAHCMLALPNDMLLQEGLSLTAAQSLRRMEERLARLAAGLAASALGHGLFPLDLASLRAVLGTAGAPQLLFAESAGARRAEEVCAQLRRAGERSGLRRQFARALYLVEGPADLTLAEIREIASHMEAMLAPAAPFVIGAWTSADPEAPLWAALVGVADAPAPRPAEDASAIPFFLTGDALE